MEEIKQDLKEIKKQLLTLEAEKIDSNLTFTGLKINSLLEKINESAKKKIDQYYKSLRE